MSAPHPVHAAATPVFLPLRHRGLEAPGGFIRQVRGRKREFPAVAVSREGGKRKLESLEGLSIALDLKGEDAFLAQLSEKQ